MQVLSMFAGFGFDWPPAIRAIFNALSLVNFNFELLAPECTVKVNFEARWYVVLRLLGRVSSGCSSLGSAQWSDCQWVWRSLQLMRGWGSEAHQSSLSLLHAQAHVRVTVLDSDTVHCLSATR
jgi:hypothetical protein